MLLRLAMVIWQLLFGLAACLLVCATVVIAGHAINGNTTEETYWIAGLLAVIGALSFGLGRVFRFVIIGR